MVTVAAIARREVEHVDQSSGRISGRALCLHAAGRYHIGSFWLVDKCASDVAFRAECRWSREVKGMVMGDKRLSRGGRVESRHHGHGGSRRERLGSWQAALLRASHRVGGRQASFEDPASLPNGCRGRAGWSLRELATAAEHGSARGFGGSPAVRFLNFKRKISTLEYSEQSI